MWLYVKQNNKWCLSVNDTYNGGLPPVFCLWIDGNINSSFKFFFYVSNLAFDY